MAIGGAFLRFGQTGLRLVEFGCAAIVLGIYSYFLAVLARHDMTIPTWEKAVEGMSGAAVLYTIFGVLFTLCFGGVRVFMFLGIFLDICFAGCFAGIAYYTRHGANSCTGLVNTPIGNGAANAAAPGAGDYGYACSLNTACFAVSVGAILLFLLSAVGCFLMARHHAKEKRFGPSPANNYTHGVGRRPFWKRNRKTHATRDAEMATGGVPATAGLNRHSHETGMTGSTMNQGYAPATTDPKYGVHGVGYHAPHQQTATNY